VGATAVLSFDGAASAAASCDSDTGVTVVVDFHQLGGGVDAVCDADGGGASADSLFVDNGFDLTYVQRQPGFVCRVAGAPARDSCVNTPPATAYWALFWSDGESGTWSYASQGVGSLTIPSGGYVAFSWQGNSTKQLPGISPSAGSSATPTPTPSATPRPRPTSSPTPAGGSSTPLASPSDGSSLSPASELSQPNQTTSASPAQGDSTRVKPNESASSASALAATSSDGAGTDQHSSSAASPAGPDGLPAAAIGGVLAGLIVMGAGTAYSRRHSRDTPS
jgi:hypothetical protein